MKVLVTGGAGFIGSHLVALLVEKGIDVCVFDSLVSGKRESIPTGVQFIQGDIRDQKVLKEAMQRMTHVVHLAALVSVSESMADPLPTSEVNVGGTENVLNAMRTAGVKHIVYASSAAVYGDELSLPKTESSPLWPLSPYALSKAVNEMQAALYERAFGLSTVGLRSFNVYGPGQAGDHPYASVIPRWIEAVRNGQAVPLYGDGSQTRDFIHVSDVARAIWDALTTEATGVFNIASGTETSIAQLQKIFFDRYGDAFKVNRKPAREGDILRSVADVSAARKVLGFEPITDMLQGMSELMAP